MERFSTKKHSNESVCFALLCCLFVWLIQQGNDMQQTQRRNQKNGEETTKYQVESAF
jgi:hypothetical protein